ncbi:hypothetical protein FB45DRAFT_1064564 [Roridomyces roridus]|uniref:Uncharacterized protein n=1 Tax=Roridomyces roridus TaxID=1738132 RepID=A0AAD7BAK8_9AGAR|nr:hypothetical protein FB45DRAFT_1064564 [Roridomyces roridus]
MPTNGHPDINDYPYFDEQTTWEELQAYHSLVAQGVDLNDYFTRHDSMTRVPEDERYLSEMNAEFDEMDIPPASTSEDFGVRATGYMAPSPMQSSANPTRHANPYNHLPSPSPPSTSDPAKLLQYNLKRLLQRAPSNGLPQSIRTPSGSPVPYQSVHGGPSQSRTNSGTHRYHPSHPNHANSSITPSTTKENPRPDPVSVGRREGQMRQGARSGGGQTYTVGRASDERFGRP